MVNLKEKPYYLNEEQIRWVEDIIAGMTTEEKIGQLFVNMVSNEEERKPENIKKILDTYHPGAMHQKRSCGRWQTVCKRRQKSHF